MMDGKRIGHGLGLGRGVGRVDMGRRQSAPTPRGHAYGLRTGGDPDRGLGHQQANRQSIPGADKLTHAGRARGFRAAPLPVPASGPGVNPGAFGYAILPPASGAAPRPPVGGFTPGVLGSGLVIRKRG